MTSWGLTVLIDENGQVNLVAYGQSGFRNGDENLELAAKEVSKLQAEGLIRLFINQTVSVQQASKFGQDVKTFTDNVKKTKLTKSLRSRMEQKGNFRPINGMKQILDWSGIHPVTNGGIAGSVVAWNASEASGGHTPATRRGGLRGSTRSRDF